MKQNTNNYKKRTNKKYNRKVDGVRRAENDDASTSMCGTNDPKWYGINEQILKDVASLSFNNPLGLDLPGIADDPQYVPGVMSLEYAPGIGYSDSQYSAVNLAARRIFTYIRSKISGSRSYTSSDLMMYLLAMNSVYTVFAFAARAYGLVATYSMVNRYTPAAILKAMRVDPTDLNVFLAEYRARINMLAAKVQQFAVPSSMNIFNRSSWMVSNVFKDSPTAKSQYYVYVPNGLYTFSATTSEQGSELIWNSTAQFTKLDDWLDLAQEMVEALVSDDDIGTMSGDILNAFGVNNIMIVPQIAENYTVVPIYDEEALVQLTNASFLFEGSLADTTTKLTNMNITQSVDKNCILYAPKINCFAKGLRYNKPVTIRSDAPTPGDVMVATRMLCMGTNSTTNFGNVADTPLYMGTEIPLLWITWKNTPTGLTTGAIGNEYMTRSGNTQLPGITSTLSQFDWFPRLQFVNQGTSATAQNTFVEYVQDWDNVTVVSPSDLSKLHDAALISLFDVKAVGEFNFS